MPNQHPASEADMIVRGRTYLPFTSVPPVAQLINGSAQTLAVGDIVVLDVVTAGTITGAWDYTTVVRPTTAQLGTGTFAVVIDLQRGAGAVGSTVQVLFYGDALVNLTANASLGAPFVATNDAFTGQATASGAKYIGRSKATGTGLVRCYFDGRGIGVVGGGGGSGDALVADGLDQFAATTSAELAGVISDETGTGALVFANTPTLVTPVLGTPGSGTLTNCTGLPVAGIAASTSTALGVGSIELGHASDTTLARSAAGVVTIEGVEAVTLTRTQTLTNKTLTAPRVGTAINDTSGNEVVAVTATGSAVNEVTIANAATGNGPTISATGDDTNVALNINSKGSGAVNINGSPVIPMTITGAAQGDILARTATEYVNVNIATNQMVGRVAGEVVGINVTGTGDVVKATSPTLVTPALGTPASGNLGSCTADGTDAVGFRNIPQNSQSAAYTMVLADSGKHIYHPSADTTARTWTIPANGSVAYPVGTAITFVNDTSAGVLTIAITTDTLVLQPGGTTGSRTLAANNIATAIKVTSTRWVISGTSGLT